MGRLNPIDNCLVTWLRWCITVLAILNAGYMVADGTRALTRGDYFTPSSGEHAGELGPWARVVETVGVQPRATAMKAFFVIYGLAWLAITVAFALRQPWSWMGMLLFALGSIWYLTVGTVISVLIVVLLLVPAVHDLYRP